MEDWKIWLNVPLYGDCRVIPVLLRFESLNAALDFKLRNFYLDLGMPFKTPQEGDYQKEIKG